MPTVLMRALLAATALFAGSAAAFARSDDPPALAQEDEGDDFIELPGVGRIPLPPGARAFQPRGARRFGGDDDFAPLPPKAAAPPPPKTPEEARAAALDDLLARLKAADDESEARAIAARTLELFARNASDTIALLTARAAAAELGGAAETAQSLLDHVVALDPGWPEGFVRRARARAARGDGAGARDDLEAALRLEPRRFDALALLGALNEEAGDKKGALEAYRRALALDPRQEALRKNEERLRLDVEGRDI